MKDKREQKSGDDGRPALEWVVGAVSAVLVSCLVLYLGYQAAFGDDRPAELLVSVEQVRHGDGTTTVKVAVSNRGDEAAAAVAVLATGADASPRRIELDYVASHATRRAAFVFPGTVAVEDVTVEIGGYAEP